MTRAHALRQVALEGLLPPIALLAWLSLLPFLAHAPPLAALAGPLRRLTPPLLWSAVGLAVGLWAVGQGLHLAFGDRLPQVRKTPSWPRSRANFSLLSPYAHRNAWVNVHLLGQHNTFFAISSGRPSARCSRWPAATSTTACSPRSARCAQKRHEFFVSRAASNSFRDKSDVRPRPTADAGAASLLLRGGRGRALGLHGVLAACQARSSATRVRHDPA